jgi:putative addiction module killer protein
MPMRVKMTEVYRDWINSLTDRTARARIQVRVDRLVHGNPGQHRNLTGGVSELKIDFGPGYRVYYTERGGELIVLLAGGDKSTQEQDIKAAIVLANNL